MSKIAFKYWDYVVTTFPFLEWRKWIIINYKPYSINRWEELYKYEFKMDYIDQTFWITENHLELTE